MDDNDIASLLVSSDSPKLYLEAGVKFTLRDTVGMTISMNLENVDPTKPFRPDFASDVFETLRKEFSKHSNVALDDVIYTKVDRRDNSSDDD